MIGQKIKCENEGCDIEFEKKTHNQCYHDEECRRLATNAKQMNKYYTKQAQRRGLPRFCIQCENQLSRYNSNSICNPCSSRNEDERNSSVINMLSNVSWVA